MRGCHAPCFSSAALPLRSGQRQSQLMDSFGLSVPVAPHTSQPPPPPTAFFLFVSKKKGDETNKKNTVGGSQVLASVVRVLVRAVAGSCLRALFPPCHLSSSYLACVRLSSSVSSSSPVVAPVRL